MGSERASIVSVTSNSRELWTGLICHVADLVEEAGRIELVHELDQVAQFCLGVESEGDPRELFAVGAAALATQRGPVKVGPRGQAAEPVLIQRTGEHRVGRQSASLPLGKAFGVACRLSRSSFCLLSISPSNLVSFGDQLVVRSAVAGEEKEPQPRQADKPQSHTRQDFFATLQLHGFSPLFGRTEASKDQE